jgi:Zn-finger nucleic acid-binding protein
MKCTKCNGILESGKLKGIPIDRCISCNSLWLSTKDLDLLENKLWDDDEVEGSLFFGKKPSSILCPICGVKMSKINYRFYDLELEFCPNYCGLYLDAGEEKRIIELIKNEKEENKRKKKAEEQWSESIIRMKSKSFFDRLMKFINR